MMRTESEVQQLIQLEAARHGIILMRNNSGAMKDETGRMIFFGLGNVSKAHGERMKSSDLIGIMPYSIPRLTDDGLPSTWQIGIFVAIEVKKESWRPNANDKREQAQQAFIDFIRSKGGISGFCSSVSDFLKLIGKT